MERYLTTKGQFLRNIGNDRFILEDVFGTCTLPFRIEHFEVASETVQNIARVRLLCHEADLVDLSNLPTFKWFELEKYYVASLTDNFRYWQVGSKIVPTFDMLSYVLPSIYFDYGFGEGARADLEKIDKIINAQAGAGETPFTKQYVAIKLAHIQLGRVCSDLMSLVHRAIRAFGDLLSVQRDVIGQEWWSAVQMGAPEIMHTGPKSYNAATCVTTCVISLCSSLDISSKLVHFLNGCHRPLDKFRNAQGKHYSDLQKLKPSSLPPQLLAKIVGFGESEKEFPALVQLRHDLVHSTAALEMEKIYLGCSTDEVNGLPLHYSFMPWRDCLGSGQPERYLGREYFTSAGVDIEWQLFLWINSVIKYHLSVGMELYEFLKVNTVDDTGASILT